jgi:hypothetical protein
MLRVLSIKSSIAARDAVAEEPNYLVTIAAERSELDDAGIKKRRLLAGAVPTP